MEVFCKKGVYKNVEEFAGIANFSRASFLQNTSGECFTNSRKNIECNDLPCFKILSSSSFTVFQPLIGHAQIKMSELT